MSHIAPGGQTSGGDWLRQRDSLGVCSEAGLVHNLGDDALEIENARLVAPPALAVGRQELADDILHVLHASLIRPKANSFFCAVWLARPIWE